MWREHFNFAAVFSVGVKTARLTRTETDNTGSLTSPSYSAFMSGDNNDTNLKLEALAPCKRTEHWFTARHKARLNVVRWSSTTSAWPPKAVVFLAHGYATFASELFDWVAAVLASQGIAACALEAKGHGKSEGMPVLVERFSDLVDDYVDAATVLKAHFYEGLPMYAYGESMGGAIAIQATRKAPALFSGLVLMAPMAGIDDAAQPNRMMLAAGRMMAAVMPSAPIAPFKDILGDCFADPERLAEVGGVGWDPMRETV